MNTKTIGTFIAGAAAGYFFRDQIAGILSKGESAAMGALEMAGMHMNPHCMNGAHMGAIEMGGAHQMGFHHNPRHMGAIEMAGMHQNPHCMNGAHMGAIEMSGAHDFAGLRFGQGPLTSSTSPLWDPNYGDGGMYFIGSDTQAMGPKMFPNT